MHTWRTPGAPLNSSSAHSRRTPVALLSHSFRTPVALLSHSFRTPVSSRGALLAQQVRTPLWKKEQKPSAAALRRMPGWFISAVAGLSYLHGAGVWLIHHHHFPARQGRRLMRRTSRGGWLSRCRAWRKNAKKKVGSGTPSSNQPKTRQKRAGCTIRMPGRTRGPDVRDIAPHAAELTFYLRGCDTSPPMATELRTDDGGFVCNSSRCVARAARAIVCRNRALFVFSVECWKHEDASYGTDGSP